MLNDVLPRAVAADKAVAAAKKAKRELTAEEKALVASVQEAANQLIQVARSDHTKPSLARVGEGEGRRLDAVHYTIRPGTRN